MHSFRLIDAYRKTSIVNSYSNYKKLLSYHLSDTNLFHSEQRSKLIKLLYSLRSNEFYLDHIAHFSDKDLYNDPYSVLHELPVSDKNLIRQNYSTLSSQDAYHHEQNYTGGSTGTPFHYLLDKSSISATRGFNYSLWSHFLGYELGNSILVIAGSSLGSEAKLKKRIYNRLQNKNFISGDEINSANATRLIQHINRKKKIFIYGYPSSIIAYTQRIKRSDLNLSHIGGVITTSEMLFDQDKERIEDFFNSKVLNIYGANDGGIVAGSGDNKEFIYNGLDCYIENDKHSLNNELLLTNLHSRALPFVRYKVGDCAKVIEKSNGYPFIFQELSGRIRDLLYNQEMNPVHGSKINKIFKEFPEILKYQIIQEPDLHCVVKVDCQPSKTESLKTSSLESKIRKLLGSTIVINVIITCEMETPSNSKHKTIISHVN